MTIEKIVEEYEHNLIFTSRIFANTQLEISIESYTNQQISKVISEIESKMPKKDTTKTSGEFTREGWKLFDESNGWNEALDQVHKVLEGYKKGRE